jgi:cell division FtsZ-interacting protein ZapD
MELLRWLVAPLERRVTHIAAWIRSCAELSKARSSKARALSDSN